MIEDRETIAVLCRGSQYYRVFHGNMHEAVCMHSCAKPFQLLPVLEAGLEKTYQLTQDELAFMVSSHLGQDEHIAVFYSIIQKTGLREDELILPATAPQGRIAHSLWLDRQEPLRKCYHPCSGNHLAMMLANREKTGSPTGYERRDSFVQKRIGELLLQFADAAPPDMIVTTDYCGVPAFSLPAYQISNLYRRLARESGTDERIHALVTAAGRYPRMIEGDGCIATILNSQPGIFAKTGFGGLIAGSLLNEELGFVIKSSYGWKVAVDVLISCLSELHLLTPKLVCELKECFI